MTIIMAAFHIDGGVDFHQTFIDVPGGSYQFVWEIKLDPLEPTEIVRSYRAAIDDIVIAPKACSQMRKFPLTNRRFFIIVKITQCVFIG